MTKTAVVTGASSGIGEATARRLAGEGYRVVAAARRRERLDELAKEIGCTPITLDVTAGDSVAALAAALDECHILVNNAGGAYGLEPVAQANADNWQRMWDVNVMGLMHVTKALLPRLIASGDAVVVNVGSIAGHEVYDGGAGYTAVKHAVSAITETMRLELLGQPVRVTEIAPGLVQTEEFSLNRFAGDRQRAGAVYQGVPHPLTAEDIADAIAWIVSRPPHVNIDLLVVKPRAQATAQRLHRE